MNRLEILKKLNGEKFYSYSFGNVVEINEFVLSVGNERVLFLSDESILKILVQEFLEHEKNRRQR